MPVGFSGSPGARPQFQRLGRRVTSTAQHRISFMNCIRLDSRYGADILILSDSNGLYRQGGKKYLSSPTQHPRGSPGESKGEEGERNGEAGQKEGAKLPKGLREAKKLS